MASLFALGVMSVAWMAFVAALIAVEKMLPWRRVATYGTAAILLCSASCCSSRRIHPRPDGAWIGRDAFDGPDGDEPLADHLVAE